MPTVEYSIYTSKRTIWVLAQRDPSFAEFYLQYQDQIVLPTPLSVDFWDDVIAIAEKEPDLSSAVKRCRENTQSAQSFAIPGLPEIGVLIAALFLLRTHIKIHRTDLPTIVPLKKRVRTCGSLQKLKYRKWALAPKKRDRRCLSLFIFYLEQKVRAAAG